MVCEQSTCIDIWGFNLKNLPWASLFLGTKSSNYHGVVSLNWKYTHLFLVLFECIVYSVYIQIKFVQYKLVS